MGTIVRKNKRTGKQEGKNKREGKQEGGKTRGSVGNRMECKRKGSVRKGKREEEASKQATRSKRGEETNRRKNFKRWGKQERRKTRLEC